MAREVKDELQQPDAAPIEQPPAELPELQLPLDALRQRVAVETILSDFEAAKLAREARDYGYSAKGEKLGFDQWLKELKDLYIGRREPKKEPWSFCSNRSLMIAMAIIETLHARMLGGVYSEELTRWRPGDFTDAPKAERVEKLMFWWIRVRAKLREFFDRWVRTAIAMPYTVTETQFDVEERDTGQTQESQPFIGPDGNPVQAPPQRILAPFHTTRSDIYAVEDVFLTPGSTNIRRDPVILRMTLLFRDLEDMERRGTAINVTIPTDPNVPALATLLPVDAPSGENLPAEELEELKRVRLRNKEVTVLKWFGNIDLDGDGFPEPVRMIVDPIYRTYLGGIAQHNLSKQGIRHLDITSFMPRLDDPHGVWGYGCLEMVKEHALEIDATFNQMVDANTISILRPGFYDPSGDLDAPALKIHPNKMTPVSRPQENVFFPEIRIPTDQLINQIRLVLEFIERLTAASAYIMGKESEIVGGSGTATRTNAIVEASGQRHSVPLHRLREGAARIMTHHFDNVQTHIAEMPNLERRVLGEDGAQVFGVNELTDEGLSGEYDAYLLPDESMGSKEMERNLAQQIYAILTQNLIVASDPAKLYKITADLLKAWGKDPKAYLGPAPEIAGAVSPADEHTMMLQGDFAGLQATVTQNPIEHILAHTAFLHDPALQQLQPALQQQIQQVMAQHIQQHQQVLQLVVAASAQAGKSKSPSQGGGQTNGARRGGTQRGGPGPAAPVGPESGVGDVSSPLARAQQTQRGA